MHGSPLPGASQSRGGQEFRAGRRHSQTAPVGTTRSFVAEAEIPYEPGTIEAVAFQDGQEVGPTKIVTGEHASRIQVRGIRQAKFIGDKSQRQCGKYIPNCECEQESSLTSATTPQCGLVIEPKAGKPR
ncbi:DUF4982 domain-containing protein [Glycomyces sp. NPDC021274]|uniref:DUF4982 domain-containing protein n=1 Tax=Glycomyces sp. NPDC021274 TaxID=3155120 RepID=UPI0033D842D5